MMHRNIGIVSIAACCIGSVTLGVEAACVQQWMGVPGSELGASALVVYDDGNGPALYVGYDNKLRKWDGKLWTDIAGPTSGFVHDMVTHDFGDGPVLCLAKSGGVWTWDGQAFTALLGVVGSARTLISHDDGSGPALFVGVTMGINGPYVQRWSLNTSQWLPVGGTDWVYFGCEPTVGGFPYARGVYAFAEFDVDGNGPEPASLYASGNFVSAPGGAVGGHFIRWDGTAWIHVVGSPRGTALLAAGPTASGNQLPSLFAGHYNLSCGVPGSGCQISSLGETGWLDWDGMGSPNGPRVEVFEVFDDDGPGPRMPRLYAGGKFTPLDGANTNIAHLIKNNLMNTAGGLWGGGVEGNPWVYALKQFDDGTGPALYAVGSFVSSGSTQLNGFAKLVLQPCCAADIDASQNSTVDVDDLLVVINQWGASGGTADITVDGDVDVDDLIAVINAWGPCR